MGDSFFILNSSPACIIYRQTGNLVCVVHQPLNHEERFMKHQRFFCLTFLLMSCVGYLASDTSIPKSPTSIEQDDLTCLEEIAMDALTRGDIIYLGKAQDQLSCIAIYLDEQQYVLMKGPKEIAQPSLIDLSHPLWAHYPYHTARRPKHTIEPATTLSQEEISTISTPVPILNGCESTFVNTQELPLVLTCTDTAVSLHDWVSNHKEALHALLSEHGAILLRNFPVQTPDDFAYVVETVTGKAPSDYRSGEGSRTKVTKGVYTSTEAPLQYKISLHHELSCTLNPLAYLCFYCEIAPPPGTGQTLLGKTEEVTKAMQATPEVWDLFAGKTIRYVSRHPPEGNYFTRVNVTHKTWQSSFETDDREEVGRICEEKGFTYRWLKDWVEVTRRAPAMLGPDEFFDHPYWYNQAHLYHANPRGRGGYFNHYLANLLYIMPSTRQYDVCFDEDGSDIPRSCIYKIYDVMDAHTILFDWQKGDILLLDNHKVLHGRAPCVGPRRVLASMVR